MDAHYPPILRQLLGEERTGGNSFFDAATKEASNICGRCQSASSAAKGAKPLNRKERSKFSSSVKPAEEAAIAEWAKSCGLWYEESAFFNKYQIRKIGQGAEQKVFLEVDGITVLKVNSAIYHFT